MRKHWCEVRGCTVPGQVEVKTTDPDGETTWWSCWRHAKEYYEWFRLENEKTNAAWTATLQRTDDDTLFIAAEGNEP